MRTAGREREREGGNIKRTATRLTEGQHKKNSHITEGVTPDHSTSLVKDL